MRISRPLSASRKGHRPHGLSTRGSAGGGTPPRSPGPPASRSQGAQQTLVSLPLKAAARVQGPRAGGGLGQGQGSSPPGALSSGSADLPGPARLHLAFLPPHGRHGNKSLRPTPTRARGQSFQASRATSKTSPPTGDTVSQKQVPLKEPGRAMDGKEAPAPQGWRPGSRCLTAHDRPLPPARGSSRSLAQPHRQKQVLWHPAGDPRGLLQVQPALLPPQDTALR